MEIMKFLNGNQSVVSQMVFELNFYIMNIDMQLSRYIKLNFDTLKIMMLSNGSNGRLAVQMLVPVYFHQNPIAFRFHQPLVQQLKRVKKEVKY